MDSEDVLVSGDKVVVAAGDGPHEADFMGMPATGKRFDIQFIDIMASPMMAWRMSIGACSIRS